MVEVAQVFPPPIYTSISSLTLTFQGNFSHYVSNLDPVTLETPILKGDVFTTGRGGSGNMAKNTDPEATRLAQDVIG
jgi:hypothetical protein